jgi:spore germination protein YaaH
MPRIKYLAPLLLILASLSGFMPASGAAAAPQAAAQDPTHPFVMQQAAQSIARAPRGSLQPFIPPPTMAAVGGAGGPTREIFGFALASSLSDPTVGYPSWNFSLLSTVAFFGLHVQDDGNFAGDSGAAVWNSSQLSGLLATAHSRGVKVVLTIILQDFSPNTPHMCSALTRGGVTVAAAVAEVRAKGVDGVNIDYEGLNGSCGQSDPNGARHALTNLVRALRASLPGGYMSIDTYASSAVDSAGFFDVPALASAVDSFFVMAYDLEYSNFYRAPTNCTSFCLGPTAPLTGYYYNETTTAAQYVAAVPSSKVILGVPYYGRKSCVGPGVPNSYPTSGIVADSYLDATGESTYYLTAPGTYSVHRDPNDPAGQERYDTWLNTQLNCTRELYWDDTVSLAPKYALVNQDNLRGVGIWSLNYGGGAPELWATLGAAFSSCPVAITLAATQATTKFNVGLSSAPCSATSFDIQQLDSTLNQGWFPASTVGAANGAGTATAEGYPGHSYQFRARAHSAGGVAGGWSTATTQVAANATKSHSWNGMYVLDAYGGLFPDDTAPLATSAYWPGWKIARTAHAVPAANSPQSGAVLDGYGGLHMYGGSLNVQITAYWQGWDIARDFAFLPNGTGGYVLDGYGGLHPFSANGGAMPPATQGAAYWQGWDIARKVVIFSDGKGGYVLDAWGGLHSFGIGQPAPPNPNLSAYWHGWDIARDFALIPGTRSGYVMDGYGGVHAFSPPGQPVPPAFSGSVYWNGWDIARGVWLLPSATLAQPVGYILDGYGGLHPLGPTPDIVSMPYWHGNDNARNVFGA